MGARACVFGVSGAGSAPGGRVMVALHMSFDTGQMTQGGLVCSRRSWASVTATNIYMQDNVPTFTSAEDQ